MRKIKTYKSGFRLIVERTRSKTIYMNYTVCVGSINETPNEYGYSHFLEHLQSKSTTKRSTEQIARDKNFYGAIGNNNTTYCRTRFYNEVMKENFENLMEIEADRLQNGIFNKKEFEIEKKVVLEEFKKYESNTNSVLSIENDKYFFANTPLNREILGLKSNIKKATPSKMEKFKKKYYLPNNTIVSIAGNISLKKAEKLIKKYFPKLFEGDNLPCTSYSFCGDNEINKNYFVVQKKEVQSKVFIQFKGVGDSNSEYYIQNALTRILGGSNSSRLHDTIRKKFGYVYAIFSNASSFFNTGIFSISFATSTENIKPALIEIRKVLKDIAENGVKDEELETAKNIMKTSFAAYLRKKYNYEIADDNIYEMYFNKKIKTKKEILKFMYQVDKNAVQEFAKFIYNSNDFVVGAIGEGIKLSDLKVFGER